MNKNKKDYVFKVGDSVIVKPDVFDPDFRIPIGGWHGRVGMIKAMDNILRIDWDSLTLQNIPTDVIERCSNEELYWHQMFLYSSEVEPAIARDSPAEVKAIVQAIERGQSPKEILKKEKSNTSVTYQWTFPRANYTDHIW